MSSWHRRRQSNTHKHPTSAHFRLPPPAVQGRPLLPSAMNRIVVTRTKAAIARLRAYKPPPFPLWDKLPVSRRAAVLILLYADRQGDLRVVLTMRAASLRSFSGPSATLPNHFSPIFLPAHERTHALTRDFCATGHAAFPGGKADSLEETPCTSTCHPSLPPAMYPASFLKILLTYSRPTCFSPPQTK